MLGFTGFGEEMDKVNSIRRRDFSIQLFQLDFSFLIFLFSRNDSYHFNLLLAELLTERNRNGNVQILRCRDIYFSQLLHLLIVSQETLCIILLSRLNTVVKRQMMLEGKLLREEKNWKRNKLMRSSLLKIFSPKLELLIMLMLMLEMMKMLMLMRLRCHCRCHWLLVEFMLLIIISKFWFLFLLLLVVHFIFWINLKGWSYVWERRQWWREWKFRYRKMKRGKEDFFMAPLADAHVKSRMLPS